MQWTIKYLETHTNYLRLNYGFEKKFTGFTNNSDIHKTVVYVIDTANCTTQIPQNIATCFDQSYGHPQATPAR